MSTLFILACVLGASVQPTAPQPKVPTTKVPASKDSAAKSPATKGTSVVPAITEVLYDVPKDQAGDADQDGKRSATGDEFVEVCNTSGGGGGGGAIELKGYALVDSDAWWFLTEEGKKPLDLTRYKHDGKDFVFIFPACSLAPGQCAAVFNGYAHEDGKSGTFGTHEKAQGKNDRFAGAFVFGAGVKTSKASFGNDGDWVALVSPEGVLVEVVSWGKPDRAVPGDAKHKSETPAKVWGSVERVAPGGEFVDSATLGDKTKLFTPGVFGNKGESKKDEKAPKPDEPKAEPKDPGQHKK